MNWFEESNLELLKQLSIVVIYDIITRDFLTELLKEKV